MGSPHVDAAFRVAVRGEEAQSPLRLSTTGPVGLGSTDLLDTLVTAVFVAAETNTSSTVEWLGSRTDLPSAIVPLHAEQYRRSICEPNRNSKRR
jgi:hypothetical protein